MIAKIGRSTRDCNRKNYPLAQIIEGLQTRFYFVAKALADLGQTNARERVYAKPVNAHVHSRYSRSEAVFSVA